MKTRGFCVLWEGHLLVILLAKQPILHPHLTTFQSFNTMKAAEKTWIERGYTTFAYEGPQGLKVERLAKATGKNKSSFYHLFADMEVFILRLLDYHLAQAKIMVDKEAAAEDEATVIDILVGHKIDLLFSRQLRIHRENKAFEACFQRINAISVPAMLAVWKKMIGLEEHTYLAQMVLHLSLENFYLQITDQTLNVDWLSSYFANIRTMVRTFKQLSPEALLNGSVYKAS